MARAFDNFCITRWLPRGPTKLSKETSDECEASGALLAPMVGCRRGQSPDMLRDDGIRSEIDEAARRPPMAGQKAERADDNACHRSARRLDRHLARESHTAMDRPAVRALVRRIDGRHTRRDGSGRALLRRRSELPRR